MKALAILLALCAPSALLLATGCGSSEPPVAEAPKPEPEPEPPKPKPITLSKLKPVTLEPGAQAKIELAVERNDNTGPIEFELGELPKGVSVETPTIAEDKSAGQMIVKAAQSLGDEPLTASFQITAKIGEQTASQQLAVNVPKLNLPSLLPMAAILVQPGQSTTTDVKLKRNGFKAAVPLRIEDATDKVRCKLANTSLEQDTTKLQITVAGDAPDTDLKLRVTATLYGRQISTELPLKVERKPFQVKSFKVVTVEPGQTQRIEVPIERGSYKGPLDLQAEDLPEGVTIKQVKVAADKTSATLELTADADLDRRVQSSRVVSKAGHLTSTGPIVIRIGDEDDSYLPPALTANPEITPLLRRGSIGGRLTSETKQALLDFYGGTAESEAAVMRGLKWFAVHQQPDGSWPLHEYSKDIPNCDCQEEFESGVDKCDIGGTAFGVLAFLGGRSHPQPSPKKPT